MLAPSPVPEPLAAMSTPRLALLAVPVLVAAAPLARAQEEPAAFEVTQELLDRLHAEALPRVKEALGAEFADGPSVRLATAEDVEAVLYAENLRLMGRSVERQDLAREQAEASARSMAWSMLSKYSFADDAVLIPAASVARYAELVGAPELYSEPVVRVLVLLELVQGVADRVFGVEERLFALKGSAAVQAYVAVIKGHAMHVARAICAEQGWSDGFEAFAAAIRRPVLRAKMDELGAARVELLELRISAFDTTHYSGERFVATVERLAGSDAVRRLFRAPPKDLATIFEPAWYLRPEGRTEAIFELDAALDVAGERFDAELWRQARLSATPSQVGQAIGLLPGDAVARVKRTVRQNRILQVFPADGTPGRSVSVALYELASSDDAAFFVRSTRRLNELKDERMGNVKDPAYAAFERAGLGGFLIRKTIDLPDEDKVLASVVAARGTLAVEVLHFDVPASDEHLVALAGRLLDAVKLRAEAAPAEGR